jgi:hypothetical protein
MLTQEQKEKNLSTFRRYLTNLIGAAETNALLYYLGGDNAIIDASFGMTKDSGCAYEGAFLENVLRIADIAMNINDNIFPEEKRVAAKSIYRSVLLQHLAKVIMYEDNTNQWEIDNRGILYKFKSTNVVLKGGERVILLLLKSGIQDITEEEYEAIRIIDKMKEDDFAMTKHVSTLACIVRQANEINTMINTH